MSALPETVRRELARAVLTRVRRPGDGRRDRPGRCAVCGALGRLAFSSWVIPREIAGALTTAELDAYRRRESMFCRRCASNLRVRRIAEVLVSTYGERAGDLVGLLREAPFRALDVAEVNSIGSAGSMHVHLRRHPRLAYSEYAPGAAPGATVGGVRNEDVCALTYGDAAFDLILTSDTLEHVPDVDAAFRECRRTLRPGGRLVFTVPMVPLRPDTRARASLVGGALRHHQPPQHHGRGSGPFRLLPTGDDLLAFTDFGEDVVGRLADAGFRAVLDRVGPPGPLSDAGIVVRATAVAAPSA